MEPSESGKTGEESAVSTDRHENSEECPVVECDIRFPGIPEDLTDVILVVEGRQLHVSRTVLAHYSPVFYKMFFSDFKEKEATQIALPDEKVEDMVTFFNILFPRSAKDSAVDLVKDDNLLQVLALADKYDAEDAKVKCQDYIGDCMARNYLTFYERRRPLVIMTPGIIQSHFQPPPLRQLLLLLLLTSCIAQAQDRPNIIFIVLDDAGYSDFQSTDPTMATPHMRALREEGVFLNQSYVLPMCAPSRAAFMTGRYPHTFGLQDASVNSNMVNWISETFTFLPRELQRLNYTTHMLGKWHLGFCHPAFTPRGRGFDSFYGFWLGSHDSYYNHTKNKGRVYDWWENDDVDFSARGVYQTELLNARAVKLVQDFDPQHSKPFFLYLSYGAPHGPFEVPQHYMDTYCHHITNTSRRIHCGMMAVVDIGVGALVGALKEKGIYDETVIVLLSDNGGPIKDGSVNYPLRAGKKNLYEGGIRSYTLIRGPGFAPNSTWSGLIHAIDWFPTLIGAAGGERPSYTHGYDMYETIRENRESLREDFIIVSDFPKFNHTLLRWKQWKLLTSVPGLPPGSRWTPGFSSGWYPPYQLLEAGEPWENVNKKYPAGRYLLYNLEQDPQEKHDLYPEWKNEVLVQTMKQKIVQYLGEPGVHNGTHPLQPWPAHIPRTTDNAKDGVVATCWCHPKGLPDCREGGTTPGERSSSSPDTSTASQDTSGGVAVSSDFVFMVVLVVSGLCSFCF